MINESSALIANGDSDLEYSTDGDNDNDETIDDILDAHYASCTWKEYFFSWRFWELLLCLVPSTALWMIFESNTLVPRMRPMPFEPVITTIIDGSLETAMNSSTLKDSNGDAWGWDSSGMVWNHVNSEKFINETIGHKEYQILFGALPCLLQLALVLCLESRKGRRWDALHRTICMFFVGIGTTDVITNCVKYYVGYLRPIFLDICRPYYDENDSTFHCSNKTWDVTDARMSFPSNHSGWSFCGMMLLSLFLEQNFGLSSFCHRNTARVRTKREKILRQRNRLAVYRLRSMLCYLPMLFAVFVAASRVVDNKHFPADVIGGALLGGSVASLVFGIWFPPPESGLI